MNHDLVKLTRVAQAVALVAMISVPAAHSNAADRTVHDTFERMQQKNARADTFNDRFTHTSSSFNDLTRARASKNLATFNVISAGGTQGDSPARVRLPRYVLDGESGSIRDRIYDPEPGRNGGWSYYVAPALFTGGAVSESYQGLTSMAPVPEPEIYAMMIAGFGLMGFIARRRARLG